jgi:hypothetical protein
MQRFSLSLEFPDLKPQQWTRLREMAEQAVREDSGGESGLDDATDGWDLGYWLFRLILSGHCVLEVLGEEHPVKASFEFEDSIEAADEI